MSIVLHLLGSKAGNRPRPGRTISQALKARQAPGGHTLRMEQPEGCARSHDSLSDLRDETPSLTLPSTSSARDGDKGHRCGSMYQESGFQGRMPAVGNTPFVEAAGPEFRSPAHI